MRGTRLPLPIGSAPAPATVSLACLGLESVAGRSAPEPTEQLLLR